MFCVVVCCPPTRGRSREFFTWLIGWLFRRLVVATVLWLFVGGCGERMAGGAPEGRAPDVLQRAREGTSRVLA